MKPSDLILSGVNPAGDARLIHDVLEGSMTHDEDGELRYDMSMEEIHGNKDDDE